MLATLIVILHMIVREIVESGGYNVLFMSPEMLIRKGREKFSNEVYKELLV